MNVGQFMLEVSKVSGKLMMYGIRHNSSTY